MPEELRLVPRPVQLPPPTMRDLLAVLFRQRRLLLGSFMATFLAILLYGIIAPPYQAEMKVLVRHGRLDPMVTPTPSQAEFEREGVTEEELNSQAELMHDDEILRTVVQNCGLTSEGHSWFWSLIGDSPERQLARAVRRVSKRLTVEPVRKTTLITANYESSDAAQATNILRALGNAYLARHQQLRRPSGGFGFFEQQVTQSRHALEEAELRLMEFTRDQGVVSAALERDATLQKLSEADADARQTRVSIAETTERIRALEAKLSSLPERTVTEIRNSDNPELMGKMKARLLDLQLARTELLTKYEPSYRPVRDLDRQIAEAQAEIVAEDQAPIRQQTSDKDPNHEWAQSELVKAQVEMKTLAAHAVAESALLANYREAARLLGDRAIEQEQLLHDLNATEDTYLLYLNKREEARIGDALDQGGILNVTIAEQPTVPALPKLSVLGFGLLGLVAGGTLSTSLAFAADYLNPAFRTPDEVLAYLGSPVLASLPRRNA
jgi:polysaccharide biosynthesis transport protein